MHLSPEQLTFLAGFARSAQGKVFKQVLEDRLAEVDKQLRRLTDAHLLQAQGRAQELEALLTLIDNAQHGPTHTQTSRSQGTRRVVTN